MFILFPTEGDKAKVVESLRQKGIDVSLDLPQERYWFLVQIIISQRCFLAEGLPESLPSGYDNLSDLPMGTSRSVEAVKLDKVKKAMVRLNNEISGILGAGTLGNISDKSVFVREKELTASVFVKLGAGRSLGENRS